MAAALAVTAGPLVASAAAPHGTNTISDAVFVQTNDKTGNQILAYARSATGSLSFVHAYDTGGKGAQLTGSAVDPLASQSALDFDAKADLLLAVNAGSNSFTAFHVKGDVLSHPQVVHTGSLPTSVTSHGDYVYVLAAGGKGTVHGYSTASGSLVPILGSVRSLGLDPTASPQFLNTPGQLGVTPDGTQLVVTTKANGSTIDVARIGSTGNVGRFVENPSATPVPFAFAFDPHGRLVVTEAADSDVSTYGVDSDGSLTNASSVTDGMAAACWITEAEGYYFVMNAGSADVSSYQVSSGGVASLVAADAGSTDAGPIDAAASSDGAFLYVEAGGAGTVDEFAVTSSGTLTSIGSATGLSGTGIEGIVAS